MIHVDFAGPQDAKWRAWIAEAEAETRHAIESVRSGEQLEFKGAVYRGVKGYLFETYGGKCAFCEVRITGNQPGDVEHYRPKADVCDEGGKRVVGGDPPRPHPGYYWLAYDWRNLLPSCNACNRPHTGRAGQRLGKRNQFPVRGFRAFEPGEETREEPLLVHPAESVDTHLQFGENGIAVGLTDRGTETIRVLCLNRDGLLEERRRVWQAARSTYLELIQATLYGGPTDLLRKQVAEYERGHAPYSAVGRSSIGDLRERLRHTIGGLI